ncbi:MAG: MBL fold metallo-hydrolase [Clostridia bacterium]|nr:MBL fold metallo-hydrolase [Clostridia bacterium]
MKELYKNTWCELDGGVRIFLLAGSERALAIDTGMRVPDVRGMISAHTGLPCALLNTHADRDHISSNFQFEDIFMHASEIAYYRSVSCGPEKNIIPVFGGDKIDLGGRELEIIHLPGHTPGSVTVLDNRGRCLIGGDPVQEDGDIFMFGPQRDMRAYIESLKRLDKMDDFDYIFPSHANEKVSRSVIPKLISGAEAILAGKIKGTEKEVFGKNICSYDVGVSRFLCEK